MRGVGCFGRVNVEKRLIHAFWRGGLGETDRIANLALVVLHLALCVVNAGKLPEHFHEIRLPLRQEAERHEKSVLQRGEAEMLLIENLLGAHELLVKAIERQPGGKHGVLHVKETVIAGREVARFGDPSFRARIRGVDGDMNDFGDRQRPFADGFKVALVPIRVGDDIHGGMNIQRASAFERFDIFFHRDALAVALETFVVDRFDPEEHIFQAEAFPQFEDFFVSDENVAARLEIILFLDVALFDFAGKSETMFGLNERNVVDDEHSVFLDTRKVFGSNFCAQFAVIAAVKRPSAAEGAVPGTTARKFDRGAGIEHADEVFPPPGQHIARRLCGIQVLYTPRSGPVTINAGDTRQGAELFGIVCGFEYLRRNRFALSAHNARNGAFGMSENFFGGERSAVAAGKNKAFRKAAPD